MTPTTRCQRQRQRQRLRGAGLAAGPMLGARPPADVPEQHHRDERQHGEERDAPLAERQHHEGGEQRPDRGAGVAADLEHRLREAVAPARGGAGDPARVGMEDRRADADRRSGDEQRPVALREGEDQEAAEARAHAGRRQPEHRPPVGEQADPRLQQRGRALEDQVHQPDLGEAQPEVRLEHRIERRQQRLDGVVQHVADAERHQHQHGGPSLGAGGSGSGGHGGYRRALARPRRARKREAAASRGRLARGGVARMLPFDLAGASVPVF